MFETKEETRGSGFYQVSEANGHLSREQIVVSSAAAAILEVGTVLGKVTASGEYMPVDLAATDGTEVAAGILFGRSDATDADVRAVAHVRDCEVDGNELVYPDGATSGDIEDINEALAALGIIVRV